VAPVTAWESWAAERSLPATVVAAVGAAVASGAEWRASAVGGMVVVRLWAVDDEAARVALTLARFTFDGEWTWWG
jgi:hypothetical protein